MKKMTVSRALGCAGLALALTMTAQAQAVPASITHQGRLYTEDGEPVTGSHTLRFALYESAGADDPVWQEEHEVDLDAGYFAVALGADEPLLELLDGSALHLGITVDDDDEMTPRARVGSVPYALSAAVCENATGDITPTSVEIAGYGMVIDGEGKWVGDPTGLKGCQRSSRSALIR